MASHSYQWRYGNVHYHTCGLGDPIVLIHNIYPGASYEEYEHNLHELSRRFTVYSVDLLGFGQSDAPRLKYTARTYIELIEDFLVDVVGRPAHVVSSGLSSAYVTEVSVRRPDMVDRLIFICPRSEPTGLDSPRWFAPVRRFFLSTPPLASGFYETMTSPFEVREFLGRCVFNSRLIQKDTVERLVDNAAQPGAILPYASLITGYLDFPLLAALPKVDRPILLIWGRQARPTPVEHSVRLVALARDCRLAVIEQAGAWVHYERSAKVNRLITSWCEGADADLAEGTSSSSSAA